MWPYGSLWGDRQERRAVRDHLKKIWEENNNISRVRDTLENVTNEKDEILTVGARETSMRREHATNTEIEQHLALTNQAQKSKKKSGKLNSLYIYTHALVLV